MTDSGDFEALDFHGYPTDDCLDAIRHWTGTPRDLVETLLRPTFAAYGYVEVERDGGLGRPVVRVTLVTGGWSGCEEVISALDRGLWRMFWQSSTRGGMHVYEVPAEQWEEPQIEWNVPTGYESLERKTLERAVQAVEDARDHFTRATNAGDSDLPVLAYDDAIAAIRGVERQESS